MQIKESTLSNIEHVNIEVVNEPIKESKTP